MALIPDVVIGSTDLKQITKGETVRFKLQFISQRTKQPVDVSAMTSGTLELAKADGTTLVKDLTHADVEDGPAGLLTLMLADDDTTELAAGEEQSIEATIVTSGTTGGITIVTLSPVQVSDQLF